MAKTGAQFGNKNSIKNRDWANALRLALKKPDEGDSEKDPLKKRKRLDKIAEIVVTLAEEGDMQAIKEVGDRMDGKPAQSVDLGGEVGFNVTIPKEDADTL